MTLKLFISSVQKEFAEERAALEQQLAKTRALKQGMLEEPLTDRIRLV